MRRFTRDIDRCGRCPDFTMDPEKMGERFGRPRCLASFGPKRKRCRTTSPIGAIPDWCPLPKVEEKKK